MKNNLTKKVNSKIANTTAKILTGTLIVSANTASTFYMHDPKQPKTLDKFKKIK